MPLPSFKRPGTSFPPRSGQLEERKQPKNSRENKVYVDMYRESGVQEDDTNVQLSRTALR